MADIDVIKRLSTICNSNYPKPKERYGLIIFKVCFFTLDYKNTFCVSESEIGGEGCGQSRELSCGQRLKEGLMIEKVRVKLKIIAALQ